MILINLNFKDFTALEAMANLAGSKATTYLPMLAGTIGNTFGTSSNAIPSNAALLATTFTPRTVGPVLQSFSLNMVTGSLVLTYDYNVMTSSFMAGAFTL